MIACGGVSAEGQVYFRALLAGAVRLCHGF